MAKFSFKHHEGDGPPCAHMEPLLQGAADGSIRGIRLWYAVAHSARCGRCGNYLSRLKETLHSLRALKQVQPPTEVMARLENKIPRS